MTQEEKIELTRMLVMIFHKVNTHTEEISSYNLAIQRQDEFHSIQQRFLNAGAIRIIKKEEAHINEQIK